MNETSAGSDPILQFILATYKREIDDYQREEDSALIAALRQLSPDDTRNVIYELVGLGPKEGDFYHRMREKGWRFELDTKPGSPVYFHDDHGYPIFRSTADFPGGCFSISIHDIARVAAQEEFLQQLFSPRDPDASE